MDVDPVFIYFEKLRGGKQWHMMEPKGFLSSITFELKYADG